MKKILLLLIFFITQTVLGNDGVLKITWPVERTVFQRNSNNQATVWFSALYSGGATNHVVQYRTQLLNLTDGQANGSPTVWTTIGYNNNVGNIRTAIGNLPNLDKGWYRLEMQVIDGNGVVKFFTTRKFGIGDVFVIAGQSNSQGYEGFSLNPNSNDPNIISYYTNGYSDSQLPDAISICTKSVVNEDFNFVPTKKGPIKQSFVAFEKIKQHDNHIYPNGVDSWCYAELGKEIVDITQCPVAFFNAGASGSDVENWTESIPQNGGITHFRFAIPFSESDMFGNFPGTPYVPFRNTLQTFCSIMGVRAVLWHQGETDAELKRPDVYPSQDFTYYQNALQNLVQQSRSDFKDENNNNQINLSWFVSKVSFWRSYLDNPNPGWNDQITTNLIPKQVAVAGQSNNHIGADTDGIGMKSNPTNTSDFTRADGSFKVHFSNYGLKMLSDKWLATQPWTGNAISGKPLLPITITQGNTLAQTYTLTAPAGYAKYIWVLSGDLFSNYVGDKQTLSDVKLLSNQTIICYVSKSANTNEQNFFACQPVSGNPFLSNPILDFLSFYSTEKDILSTPAEINKQAYNIISATNLVANSGTTVNYQAGKAVILENGFKADAGTIFKAEIIDFGDAQPLNWSSENIGSGSGTSSVSSGILSINGNGSLGGTDDNIHYFHTNYSGNVEIVARINGITTTNGHRAGIMIRNTIDSNSGFYEFIIDGNGNVGKLKRKNVGDIADLYGYAVCPTSGSWIKVSKVGNTISCYFKPDDSYNWLEVIGWDDHSDNNFNSSYELGFVGYNGAVATFSNISINGTSVN